MTVKAPRDPGYGALRRAIRAAIVIPLAFGFADLVLREPQIVIFVMFGCLLMMFGSFGMMVCILFHMGRLGLTFVAKDSAS